MTSASKKDGRVGGSINRLTGAEKGILCVQSAAGLGC